MTDWQPKLLELLTAAVKGRGVTALSIIEQAGATPQTVWVPHSADEPLFLAYSITKTFTAALALKLCEEGLLSLDAPLDKWFPTIEHASHISIRQLLNHTAGIPDYGGNAAYHEAVRSSPSLPWSFEQFAAETFEKGMLFAPGQGWAYSNPGYLLVKRIAEEVTGSAYRELIAEQIAQPLGLHKTFVPESIADLASLAPGTSSLLSPDGSPREVGAHYHPGWVSHGVVASTASEIVRFLDRLFQGQFLSRHSLEQMLQLVFLPIAPSPKNRQMNRRYVLANQVMGLA